MCNGWLANGQLLCINDLCKKENVFYKTKPGLLSLLGYVYVLLGLGNIRDTGHIH